MEKITERLNLAFKKSGVTLRRLAQNINLSETTVGRILRGSVDPRSANLKVIADELRINYIWLFTGQGYMFSDRNRPEEIEEHPYPCVLYVKEKQETFNRGHNHDEFTDLALQIIREENISTDELVAAVQLIRRRRKQPPKDMVKKLKGS